MRVTPGGLSPLETSVAGLDMLSNIKKIGATLAATSTMSTIFFTFIMHI